MTNISPEQMKRATGVCDKDLDKKWYQCMADALNKKPYEWDWKIQEDGAPIINEKGNPSILMSGIKKAAIVNFYYIKPNFTRSGKWHINPDNPLNGKPEGLSDDATVILKLSDMWGAPMVVNHIPDNIWQHTVSFVVLEGGNDV